MKVSDLKTEVKKFFGIAEKFQEIRLFKGKVAQKDTSLLFKNHVYEVIELDDDDDEEEIGQYVW